MHVQAITVCPDRVDVVVGVSESELLRTTQSHDLNERALGLLPGLRLHDCDNTSGLSFAEELTDTEVPHLFEHVVMELMAKAGSPRSLKGETQWDFRRDGRGIFRVSVEYDDDLVCLGAIKAADRVMDYLLEGGVCPDLGAEALKLNVLREHARAS
ncbi:MAG TPA: hypothetical protein VFE45_07845 [Coriobacteriia bacterium]|nr:hypothetical protein [Coriobacteriia bacterium]